MEIGIGIGQYTDHLTSYSPSDVVSFGFGVRIFASAGTDLIGLSNQNFVDSGILDLLDQR